eukprot:TRINITY_DN6505_c0_g1_i1.p1 TRINITY_DN6505_c0_g1~~TRINITY_DN6505_c0_g1_i1.p1  ORF type:complete len:332 (-),score=92.28 TRINITY_DN6505_c0_g1_i1:342-1337(-)
MPRSGPSLFKSIWRARILILILLLMAFVWLNFMKEMKKEEELEKREEKERELIPSYRSDQEKEELAMHLNNRDAKRTMSDSEVALRLKYLGKKVVIKYDKPITRFMGDHMLGPPPRCPLADSCIFVEGEEKALDGIIYHLPQGASINEDEEKSISRILFCMESEEIYTSLKDAEFMGKFDVRMTYKLSSDILSAYYTSDHSVWRRPPKDKVYSNLLYVASNCRSERDDVVKEIQEHIEVDSYGRCLNNKEWPGGGLGDKYDLMTKYKFYLAFESHRATDYVTEKFFHPLYAGTIPIYLGAPNIEEFAPPHSYIDYNSFKLDFIFFSFSIRT